MDLLLFRKEGDFLLLVPDYVNILDTPEDMKRLYGSLSKAGKFALVKLFGSSIGRIFDGKPSEGHMMLRWKKFYSKVISPLPQKYDVAIAYLEGESAYYICDFVDAAKRLVWIHSDYSKLGQRASEDLSYFEKADHVVTISAHCANVLKESFSSIKDRVCVLENITSAAAVRKLAEGEAPKEYHKDKFTIVSVGRLTEAKGFDIAVQAATLLKKRGADFEWFIVGQGELRDSLQKQIDESGVSECMKLLGIRTNPYPYIKNADLLVQPSRFEGKSIVVDEAKILSTPVLITAYSTAKDQILSGVNGWIVDMNAEAVAQDIETLMNTPEQLENIRRNQQKEKCGNEDEVLKYKALFDD